MKLPEKIQGRNRIRDAAIVLFFKRDGLTYLELAEKFKLTERRILQILSKNHAFIKRDKDWEKEKRIHRLEQWIKTAPKPESNALTLQQELRVEIEGDPAANNASKETKIIIVRSDGTPAPARTTDGRADNQAQVVSRSLSI